MRTISREKSGNEIAESVRVSHRCSHLGQILSHMRQNLSGFFAQVFEAVVSQMFG